MTASCGRGEDPRSDEQDKDRQDGPKEQRVGGGDADRKKYDHEAQKAHDQTCKQTDFQALAKRRLGRLV